MMKVAGATAAFLPPLHPTAPKIHSIAAVRKPSYPRLQEPLGQSFWVFKNLKGKNQAPAKRHDQFLWHDDHLDLDVQSVL